LLEEHTERDFTMKKYSILDVSKKCGLDIQTIEEIINAYNLPTSIEEGMYNFDANSYILLCKASKILKQNISPEAQRNKIFELIRSGPNNITISDVANVAGVSIGAVSTVLNNRESNIKISDHTKNRIMSAVKELGYRPNPFASALRTKQTGIVGAVVRDIGDPFLRQLIKDVQIHCNANGLDILMSHAKHEAETAEKQIDLMLHQWFDGLIILGDMHVDDDLMYNLSRYNIPVVSLNGNKNEYLSTVRYDDIYGTHLVFDYLYGLGHREIAFIGNTKHASVQERLDTFLALKKKHGLNCSEYLTYSAASSIEVLEITKKIINMPTPPTAIFCSSDYLAIAATVAIFQSGKKIPEDISIIGYDDIEDLNISYIPLTTIKQPTNEAAGKAVNELMKQIAAYNTGEEKTPVSILIKPKLIERKSCAAPQKK
jgi:DNA-binding LacI/PurR family transcriptional regulator